MSDAENDESNNESLAIEYRILEYFRKRDIKALSAITPSKVEEIDYDEENCFTRKTVK